MKDTCFPQEVSLPEALCSVTFVKYKKFAQDLHSGHIHRLRKSGVSVEGCHIFLCKSPNEYPQPPVLVENPCVQSCGQCGKLRVINRYSVPLLLPENCR